MFLLVQWVETEDIVKVVMKDVADWLKKDKISTYNGAYVALPAWVVFVA